VNAREIVIITVLHFTHKLRVKSNGGIKIQKTLLKTTLYLVIGFSRLRPFIKQHNLNRINENLNNLMPANAYFANS